MVKIISQNDLEVRFQKNQLISRYSLKNVISIDETAWMVLEDAPVAETKQVDKKKPSKTVGKKNSAKKLPAAERFDFGTVNFKV